ncbi:RING finger protein nhl-1-like [Cylas formicarius]|uniref:RING finger protein nhl-1-like n=1 Tax=Cylas formicarius TaxID=197179 RepID=UPI002958D77B|nr:RING finger protein nhl-1-like [Cylas formicarius]
MDSTADSNDYKFQKGKKKSRNPLSLKVHINTEPRTTFNPSRAKSNRSDSLGAIEELVQCGICLDRLSHPRMLPCQHTFCLSCLQTHLAAKNLKLKKLPVNDNELSIKKHINVRNVKCPVCQQVTDLPDGINNLGKLPKNLYIDSLLRLLKDDGSLTTPACQDYSCANCQTLSKDVEQCCQHCMKLFCNVCWNEHLTQLESNLSLLVNQLLESETRLKHKNSNFDARCDKLEEKVRHTTQRKIDELRRNEKKVIEEIESIKQEGHISADILNECVKKLREEIILKPGKTDYQKVSTYLDLHKQTSKLLEQVNYFGETRITFDPLTFKLEQCTEAVYNGEEEEQEVVATITNPFESIDSLVKYYRSKSFTPKLLWTKCPRPAGIGVPPWDDSKLFIAATDSHDVLIIDKNKFKLNTRLYNANMICPVGVTFSAQRKETFVTDKWKHCIHVFSSDGVYLRNICNQKLRSPEGIAMGPDEEILVCDTGNDRVLVVDPESGEKVNIIGPSSGTFCLNFPTSVAIHGGKIVVMDSGNNRVKIFNRNGEFLSEFGSFGSNPGQFRYAEVVAVDQLGFIFVGDSGNARIQVFKPDGTVVKIFGTKGGFKWVSGILITPDLNVIATDIKSRNLRIF